MNISRKAVELKKQACHCNCLDEPENRIPAKCWVDIERFEDALLLVRLETIKECAAVATTHAMEHGPSKDFTMGGHRIAEKIKAIWDS